MDLRLALPSRNTSMGSFSSTVGTSSTKASGPRCSRTGSPNYPMSSKPPEEPPPPASRRGPLCHWTPVGADEFVTESTGLTRVRLAIFRVACISGLASFSKAKGSQREEHTGCSFKILLPMERTTPSKKLREVWPSTFEPHFAKELKQNVQSIYRL